MKTILKLAAIAAAFGLAPAAAATTAAPAPVAAPAAANAAAPTPAAAQDAARPAAPPALAPTPGIGQPDGRYGLPDQVTPIGHEAAWFNDVILVPVIVAISLLVMALLLWVIVRYRRAAHETPSRTSHNTVLEVIWTLVPVLILVAIAIPSIRLLAHQYSPPDADLTVKVIGNQWFWEYEYPDNGIHLVSNMQTEEQDRVSGDPRQLGVDHRLVVPAGAVVKVIVTSNDVIHSWGVPAFWVKIDAVPGRLNETWFKVDRPGVYYGVCYELCGARHGFMPIAVEVLPRAQFAQWVASQGGHMAGAEPAGTAAPATSADAAPAPAPAATGEAANAVADAAPASTNQSATR
jgi:cytochrome c oxidase subunit 2